MFGANAAFAALPDAGQTNPANEAVVRRVYSDLLDRAPDQEGLAFFTKRMADSGLTEAGLRAEIRNSREYRGRVSIQGVFAPDGADSSIRWPLLNPNVKPVLWTSRIPDGCSTGTLASAEFEAPRHLLFYLAGYPAAPAMRITLLDTATGEELEYRPADDPGETWRLVKWQLGMNWAGRMVRLVAADGSARPDHGWIGISEPLSKQKSRCAFMNRAFYVAGLSCLHFILFLLPGWALALFIPPGLTQKPGRLLSAVLILSCAWGYAAFWVYFANCFWGKLFSGATVLMVLVALLKHRRRIFSAFMAREIVWPAALVASVSVLVLSLGFVYKGTETPLKTSANRFSHALPVDQALPLFGAEKIYAGRTIVEAWKDTWRFSDRPPLQTGIVLLQSPLFMDSERINAIQLHYLCLAAALQCLALAGVWIFLRQINPGRLIAFGALSFIIFAPTFIVNSFFVWPKLLAVPFMFIILVELLFRKRSGGDNCGSGLIIGASAALAMLAHGGSIFGLIGIGAAALILRRPPAIKTILCALLPFAAGLLSWTVFQKIVDPPGDALIKMHMGGSFTPWDDRSILATIIDSYSRLSLGEIVQLKLANLATVFGYAPERLPQLPAINCSNVVALVRPIWFFNLIPAIGPLILTIPGLLFLMVLRRAETPVSAAGFKCLLVAGITTLAWCLMMFCGTCVHQGTLFNPVVLTLGLALICFRLSRCFAIALLALQIVLFALVYLPQAGLSVPWRDTMWLQEIDFGMGAMAVLALGAYLALLRKAPG